MPLASAINSCGLVFDIIGATLIWRFGLPAEISRTGAQHLILEESDASEAAKALRYDRISWWGFASLVLGFVLQLVSNFL
jgi:hypothetical protein